MLKSEYTVSNNTVEEDGGNNCSNNYDLEFPTLPDSKTMASKNIEEIAQCTSSSKEWATKDVNSVFTIEVQDRKSDGVLNKSHYICSQITRETGVEIEISIAKNMNLTFLVIGKADNIIEAKRRIIASFQTQATSAVSVPKEHHCQVMGKPGICLNEIEQHTGAHIQMHSNALKNIQGTSDIIDVTGTRDAVEKAIQEILTISDVLLSKKAFHTIKIPKIFHPFITGGHNEKLESLMKKNGVKIHVPPPFIHKDEIKVVGDREGVQLAIINMNQVYIAMKNDLATVYVEIPKQKHKYLMVCKGNGIQDILLETNCSVELPRQDSDEETVILRGLFENLNNGLKKLKEKANYKTIKTIECPGWMHKFLIGKNGTKLQELIKNNKKVHITFTLDNKIILEGPTNKIPEVIESFKKAIFNYVSTELVVESKFIKYIIGKNGSKINRIRNDTGVIINIYKSDYNSYIIRIEGQKDGVEIVKNELEKKIYKAVNAIEKEISIDQRHHGAIIGVKGEKVKELQEAFNVQIQFSNTIEARSNLVKISGLNDDVNKAFKSLTKLAEELDENNYVLEIPIAKTLLKHFAGATIKKIREETDTKIDLPRQYEDSDTIKVMGNKEKVLMACDMIKNIQYKMRVTKNIVLGNVEVRNVIVNLGNKFIQSIKEGCGNVSLKLPAVKGDNTIVINGPENDVDNVITQIQTMVDEVHSSAVELKVKPEFQKYLIGKKRDNIKRIQDLTNTRIIFPPETDTVETKNEKMTIVGKKENVEKAKLEFEVMITDISHVFEDCVEINEKYHKSFVADDGEFLHKLEEQCGGITISFPKPGAGDKVVLKGSNANVAIAKQRLLDHAKILENIIQVEVNVKLQFQWYFFAQHGKIINKIINDCNGVSITFPKLACDNDIVIIKGNKSNAEEAKHKIEEIVKDLENTIEINMSVAPKHHLHFVAYHAEVINQIIAEYRGVTIVFPKFNSNSSEVRIKGHKDFVEKVKNKINNIVIDLEQRVTIDVIIPQRMHRVLLKDRNFMESMRQELDVWIKFPEKPAEDQCYRKPEDVNVGEEIDENCAPSVNDLVTIFGKPENCESAKMKLINHLHIYEIEMTIGPEFHPLIIGKKGDTIRDICNKYGVRVHIPKRGKVNNENVVTVVGNQKSAESARDVIQEMVDKLKNAYKEEIYIDRRIYSKLVGFGGRNILKIMDTYHVDITFSKSENSNRDLVIVYARDDATQDDVLHCIDYLKIIQQDYLTDLLENEAKANLKPKPDNKAVPNSNHQEGAGFVLDNGAHPDINYNRDFPSLPGIATSANNARPDKTNLSSWKSGRR